MCQWALAQNLGSDRQEEPVRAGPLAPPRVVTGGTFSPSGAFEVSSDPRETPSGGFKCNRHTPGERGRSQSGITTDQFTTRPILQVPRHQVLTRHRSLCSRFVSPLQTPPVEPKTTSFQPNNDNTVFSIARNREVCPLTQYFVKYWLTHIPKTL